ILGSAGPLVATGGALVAGGAAFGGISTGTWSGAGWGVLGGFATFAGGAIGAGLYTELRGGRFLEGFLASGLTSFVGAQTSGLGDGFTAALVRTTASAVAGGTASVIGGGKFENGAGTSAFVALLGALPPAYRAVVEYDADLRPGGPWVEKAPLDRPIRGANNVGVQGRIYQDVDDTPGFWDEGGPVSQLLNRIPGVNAVAGLHDAFQISLGNAFLRSALNVPGMPIAAAITFGSFLGQPVVSAGGIAVVAYSRRKPYALALPHK
ncbi:MAG: hypothetical protein ACREA0_16045, partial [bacterium]